MNKKILLKKKQGFKYSIILIDGIFGSGKTLLAQIMSTYKNVQNQSIDYSFDNITALNYLKKLDDQSSSQLLKIISDENFFNYEIGRKINLRVFDHTGIKDNPHYKEDINKIFINKEKKVLKSVDKKNKTQTIMGHNIFLNYNLLKKTFKNKLTLIVCVRHPVFMFRHSFNYFFNLHKSKKNFTIYIKNKKKEMPWYYFKIFDKFSNKHGDNILLLFNYLFNEIKKYSKEKHFLPVNFEQMVKKPHRFLNIIEKQRSLEKNKILLKEAFDRTNIYRKNINKGITFNKYGISDTGRSSKNFYLKELRFIKKNISKHNYKLLNKIILNYNKNWPSIFKAYE